MSEFLAEAQVLITPDTTKFRGLLAAELTAITRNIPPVPVPIVAAPVGTASTTALTSALTQQAATQQRLGLETARTTSATSAQTSANRAAVVATQKLAFAQAEVANAATAVGAAQITATRSAAAVAAANTAVEKALLTQDALLIKTTRDTLALAQAQNLEASAALGAARAQSAHAASLAQVRTAGLASGASLLGLRGAVLTAGAAFLGATIGIQAFAKAVGSAADLEVELNVFRITAGATAQEMSAVSEAARELGRDITLPGIGANDAAKAMTALAKAGLDVQDSIAGATGVLQLSLAAQIDQGRAAELVAGNLNAFGLAGEEAVRVADLLTGAANESQGSIEEMGIGLRQVAGAAALLGLEVEDTVALLTQLTRAGLAGSDAGTTLRVALVRLARPDVREEVEKLVGSLEDLDGNVDPRKIVKFADEITKTGGKLDVTNKLYKLFGENSLRVIGLLGREGVTGFQNTSKAITETGLAAEVAGAQASGLKGDTAALGNQVGELGIKLGQVVDGPLSLFVRGLTGAAQGINEVTTEAEKKGVFESFGDAIGRLGTKFADMNFQFRAGVRAAALGRTEFSAFDAIVKGVTGSLDEMIAGLKETSAELGKSTPGAADEGLGVQGVLNRIQGFDSAEVRARIKGDNNEILSVLEDEQAFLEEQLDRKFVKRRPALQRKLEQALLGVVNDIATIQRAGATDTQSAVKDAARAQQDADQALLDLLSNRREDLERAGDTAEVEGRLADAIRFEDRLQALIKQQITKIRSQVQDEKAKSAAIRELRIALIASRQEEDALRAQRAEDAAARRREAIDLDIEFAEITGSTAREIAARQRLIALLKKQQSQVKKGTTEWKRLRNLIAEQQQAIKDARDEVEEEQKTGRSLAEMNFDFMQKQQGFAANLLGNLIPSDATAGLVGNISQPDIPLNALAGVKASRDQGVTPGQFGQLIGIQSKMLDVLQHIAGRGAHPEAQYQRVSSSGGGAMDIM